MRCDPLSIDQVFDGIDGVSFVHNLVWASMSGKELITLLPTGGVNSTYELTAYSVMDGSYSTTAWKSLVPSDLNQDILSRDPFIHTIRQCNLLCQEDILPS